MKDNYSIEEILQAVNDLQKIKKVRKIDIKKNNFFQKDYSAVPKSTLNIIEEAEKTKR